MALHEPQVGREWFESGNTPAEDFNEIMTVRLLHRTKTVSLKTLSISAQTNMNQGLLPTDYLITAKVRYSGVSPLFVNRANRLVCVETDLSSCLIIRKATPGGLGSLSCVTNIPAPKRVGRSCGSLSPAWICCCPPISFAPSCQLVCAAIRGI